MRPLRWGVVRKLSHHQKFQKNENLSHACVLKTPFYLKKAKNKILRTRDIKIQETAPKINFVIEG